MTSLNILLVEMLKFTVAGVMQSAVVRVLQPTVLKLFCS